MKNLFALLIAINDYPVRAHCLKGCENDRADFMEYLKQHFGSQYRLHLKTLTNEEATRGNIIKGFDHFSWAQDGDACLLFFAGHGSQVSAPDAFSHLESDQCLETIVCYDSRLPGGRDLVDKELSYLIWKASQGKEVHFVAIMDCCHSGSNTRDEMELDVMARRVGAREDKLRAEDLLGYEHYRRDEGGRLTPPRARHVLLSAAQSNETAKEVRAYGQSRGVFSFSLLEALSQAGQPLSYADLMNRATLRVRGLVRKQTPRLDADEVRDKDLVFLSQEKKERNNTFFVSYDNEQGWLASAGALHGVSRDINKHRPAFRLADSGMLAEVTAVQASFSSVKGMEAMNPRQKYEAVLEQAPAPAITLAFAPGAAPEGRKVLMDACRLYLPELFAIEDDAPRPDYLIYAEEGKWALALLYSKRPLFQRVGPFSEEAALDFLKKLEAVAKWRQVLELSGKPGSIRDEEYLIHMEKITEPGNYTYNAVADVMDWREPQLLEYREYLGTWYLPAFRLKIKNTSYRKLWASVLYLEDNFGISNELLPCVELAPGEEQWLEDRGSDYPTNAIQVWMDDIYREWAISMIREYIKVIISTERLQTDSLNQEGLPYEGPMEDRRGAGSRPNVASAGWISKVIEIDICWPLEEDVEI
ncbi:MAG: caspase family protein [Phaeodactylibacter sp.]|nr:caspase family protein [Phaeodactylibacter sp.]